MKLLSACFILFFSFALLSGCNKDNNPISPSGPAWTQGQGLEGYGISGFGAVGRDLFAGSSCAPCSQSYVFRSTDNGLTWTLQESFHVNNHLPTTHLYTYPSEAFVSDGAELFLGIAAGLSGSIHESTDGGITWVERDTGFVENVNCFTIINNTIFAGTDHGVFASTDSGEGWGPADTSEMSEPIDGFAVIGADLFGTTPGEGMYRSADGGQDWINVNATGSNFFGLATLGTVLFAGTFADPSTGAGLFSSTDNGETWMSVPLPGHRMGALCTGYTDVFAATDSGVFASTDRGKTWKSISTGVPLGTVGTLSVEGPYLLVGTSNGVWRYSISQLATDAASGSHKSQTELAAEQHNYHNAFNPSAALLAISRYKALNK